MNQPADLVQRIANLEKEKDIMLGRLNALHTIAIVLILEREGPTEDVISHLDFALERNQADALQLPLSDELVQEMARVLAEASKLAQSVVKNRGKPRWQDGRLAGL